ncbi:unnamed protein product [Clonostachys rosea f. rosea IK726]|jgi:ABC-type phosphate/phosphonate transport system substrate-binding protein|uniref:Uncharacterized protein n=1 Tax=Clonostachys rosea f. rosea IK726 TaxID=1349383 RepID=A0ACA9UB86_BIOOC|nr:unnamed protein product [Clonostachys rosea f. rosea IK726]
MDRAELEAKQKSLIDESQKIQQALNALNDSMGKSPSMSDVKAHEALTQARKDTQKEPLQVERELSDITAKGVSDE